MEDFTTRVDRLIHARNLYKSEHDRIDLVVKGIKSQIDELYKQETTLNETLHSLRLLLDKFSDDSLNLLKSIVNKGLETIFFDRKYSIEIEITDSKRKNLRFWLLENMGDRIIKSKIPNSIGGGVQTVISVIIQIFLIRVWERRPILILDEAFSQISASYVEPFMNFMRYLVSDLNFSVLWITHDKRFLPFMDSIYEVNLGTVGRISKEDALTKIENN